MSVRKRNAILLLSVLELAALQGCLLSYVLPNSNPDFPIKTGNLSKLLRSNRQTQGSSNRFIEIDDRIRFPNELQNGNNNNNNNNGGFDWNKITGNNSRQPQSQQNPRPNAVTPAVPGMETTQSPCEDACLTTWQYNPVCGDNYMTYFNEARLRCAQRCGRGVNLRHFAACKPQA